MPLLRRSSAGRETIKLATAPLTNQPQEAAVKAPARSVTPIGFLRPQHIEVAFRALLYMMLLLLVVLSVSGTFYGMQHKTAPLLNPAQMLVDIQAAGGVFAMALLIQAVLTLAQYGARVMAHHDSRWYIAYLASLAVSVYYNVHAYYTPLTTPTALGGLGLAWWLAWALLIVGDVVPEFMAVRRR